MEDIPNIEAVDALLTALAEQLATAGEAFEIVVVGGSGLLALGVIERATSDIDVIALRSNEKLIDPRPLPQALLVARNRVARDFSLPEDWLNAGPSSLLDFGLPGGFIERIKTRRYGEFLTVTSLPASIRFTSSSTRWSIKGQASTRTTCRRSTRAPRTCCRRHAGRAPTTHHPASKPYSRKSWLI
jgi:hypothetical protein